MGPIGPRSFKIYRCVFLLGLSVIRKGVREGVGLLKWSFDSALLGPRDFHPPLEWSSGQFNNSKLCA
jgi:hypothetical protein